MSEKKISSTALKIGIAGAIGFAAIATGMFVSRRGRHLMKEAWEGRRRTRLEDRVLDALWGDPVLGRRDLDVEEVEDGVVELLGVVRSERERRLACDIAESVKGIRQVADHLQVVPRRARR